MIFVFVLDFILTLLCVSCLYEVGRQRSSVSMSQHMDKIKHKQKEAQCKIKMETHHTLTGRHAGFGSKECALELQN
jgi:hypothetical protein